MVELFPVKFCDTFHNPTNMGGWAVCTFTDVFGDQTPRPLYSHNQVLLSDFTRGSVGLWGLVGTCLFRREGGKMWVWCLPSLELHFRLGLEFLQRLFPLSFHALIQDGCHLDVVVVGLLLLGHSNLSYLKKKTNESVIISNVSIQQCLFCGGMGKNLLKYLSLTITAF